MAIMMSQLYVALKEAGASEESARKAAEEGAAYEARTLATDARVTMLIWIVGVHFAVTLAGFGLVLNHLWWR
jgi:hypothetical protein